MLFNSLTFLVFFPSVFILYWVLRERKQQNFLLLAASYFFYASWDWRFLGLLILSTFLDFYFGKRIGTESSKKLKKRWLALSIVMNLGILGTFKYFDFFLSSFVDFLGWVGFNASPYSLHLMLPIGISFYTFHGLSYVFDIYRGKTTVESNFLDYSLFVAYFPLLVAGPIERATHLLPQLKVERRFDYGVAVSGMRQILWGLFKKVVVADTCAIYVDQVFDHPMGQGGSTVAIASVLFAVQIYGDFSGYSDIALGCSRLLGIELFRNFAFPYFSRDIAEFWRRWHISLSSWFRDYLYFPLGGSTGTLWLTIRNVLIVFLVSGFWHGANWTFLFWGLLNGLLVIPLVISERNRRHLDTVAAGKLLPNFRELLQVGATFTLTTCAWIFFRSNTLGDSFYLFGQLFSFGLFTMPNFTGTWGLIPLGGFILVLFATEWIYREKEFAFQYMEQTTGSGIRWSIYSLLVLAIGLFMQEAGTPFIYFQF